MGNFEIRNCGALAATDLGAKAAICNSDHKDGRDCSMPGSGRLRHGAGNSAIAATDLGAMAMTDLGAESDLEASPWTSKDDWEL